MKNINISYKYGVSQKLTYLRNFSLEISERRKFLDNYNKKVIN